MENRESIYTRLATYIYRIDSVRSAQFAGTIAAPKSYEETLFMVHREFSGLSDERVREILISCEATYEMLPVLPDQALAGS